MPASKEVMERVAKRLEASKYGESLTGSIERQEQYIARLHSNKMACWSCGKPSSYYEAVEDTYDDEESGDNWKYFCPHCKVEMIHVVPFIAMPHPWLWGNPKIYRKDKP